jgi:xanthine dehydrogenase YagS FAD-binding subunit
MRPFQFARVEGTKATIHAHTGGGHAEDIGTINSPNQYLAGGTTLLDLMKLDVMRPARVIDINALQQTNSGKIEFGSKGLQLGAMVRMAQAADHPDVRKNFPVIAQSLQLAASAQIRNMASLGGNVLQRTRCSYFRDTSYPNCNKRVPGSGCAALDGFNRSHAVLGVSDQCIASYPGDFAQALLALDARVEIDGPQGVREIPFANLHRPPGKTPHLETTLTPGELITAFSVPPAPWARRSLFLKIRDRESYEFALASAAVALDLEGGTVKQVRIALGGVAALPWRAKETEAQLNGKQLDEQTIEAAAIVAFAQAQPREHNAFKVELGKRTLVRALHQAAALEI